MEDKEPQFLSTNEDKGTVDNPLVSVITPVLNGIKYLEACIQSILTQSYPNIEHVLIDGSSTDGTLEILSSYQARYPDRIRFISESDKSGDEAWNKGVRMAKGEILQWLGSDDMSEPDAIQAVVKFFRANPDAYFVYGECNIINEKGDIIGRDRIKDFNLEELIKDRCMIPTTSAFYKRRVIEKLGWFDTWGIHSGMDTELFIRVGQVFPMYRIEEVLSRARVHREGQNTAKETHITYLREDCMVSRRYGGGIFSGYCRRYYKFVIVERLRPILGFAYPIINKVLKK